MGVNAQYCVLPVPKMGKICPLDGGTRLRKYSKLYGFIVLSSDSQIDRWLFAQFDANDANFRMVRKKVSSEAADPTLSHGWSFFCEVIKYNAHLATAGIQPEQVSLAVISLADY